MSASIKQQKDAAPNMPAWRSNMPMPPQHGATMGTTFRNRHKLAMLHMGNQIAASDLKGGQLCQTDEERARFKANARAWRKDSSQTYERRI
jgi:hypothetical protein